MVLSVSWRTSSFVSLAPGDSLIFSKGQHAVGVLAAARLLGGRQSGANEISAPDPQPRLCDQFGGEKNDVAHSVASIAIGLERGAALLTQGGVSLLKGGNGPHQNW
jgi:hypothetical protein